MSDHFDSRLRASEERLRQISADLDDKTLRLSLPDDEWTVGDVLAHLAEMPNARGQDLAIILAGTGQPFGRDESDPVRLEAIRTGRSRPATELIELAVSALEMLRRKIADLTPEQLDLVGRYQDGSELTVAAFIERHISHVDAHIDQIGELRRRLADGR